MTRIFLDANILFSAAWREGSVISKLWENPDVQLVTSLYAMMEAQRNIQLKKPAAAPRLFGRTEKVEISTVFVSLSQDYGLPEKDRPILEAAAGSGCVILLTGDMAHFGHLIGTEAEGVRIMTVSMYRQWNVLTEG